MPVNEVELRIIKYHRQGQECLLHTPVYLAPVAVQQVAVVKIPMSRERRSPIWPWLSPMMMSLLMTHTRLYLPRMPSLFLSFQDRISKGSTRVTFYWQRSLHFKESTTMSRAMSGLAIPVHLSGISPSIIKDMWPQDSSGVAAYSLYIELVLTGIVYPQQEDSNIKIDQYNYFDIIETVPPPANHDIWGCLHYLPLISNVFLAQYDSGTFLSHLTDGGYGFDAIGSPGINMYQMYIVIPMVKGGMHYIRAGLIYKPHGLFAGNVKRWATFLRTFFVRCESEINVAPSQAYFLQKRGVGPLCCSMPSWICFNILIPCPSVVDKELILLVFIHPKHVFIPLEFKHCRDTRPLWRMAFFSYRDGV